MLEDIHFHYNNKIELDTEDGIYKSTIQDSGEDYFGISIPMKEGKYELLPNDKKVDVIYYDGNDVYKFRTVVIGRKIEKLMIILLKKPEKYIKAQRRNFARAFMMTKISFAKTKALGKGNEYEFIDATMLDISGGGMRFRVKKIMHEGEIIIIKIPVKDEDLVVRGQVIRVIQDRNNSASVGITFMDIEERVREKLIKHVFNIMREQRQRSAKGD